MQVNDRAFVIIIFNEHCCSLEKNLIICKVKVIFLCPIFLFYGWISYIKFNVSEAFSVKIFQISVVVLGYVMIMGFFRASVLLPMVIGLRNALFVITRESNSLPPGLDILS